MANAASFRTLVIMSGFDTCGNLAVESRGDVMKEPSRTTRIGSAVPVDGSMLAALLKILSWALRIVPMESRFKQDLSDPLQCISLLNAACNFV